MSNQIEELIRKGIIKQKNQWRKKQPNRRINWDMSNQIEGTNGIGIIKYKN